MYRIKSISVFISLWMIGVMTSGCPEQRQDASVHSGGTSVGPERGQAPPSPPSRPTAPAPPVEQPAGPGAQVQGASPLCPLDVVPGRAIGRLAVGMTQSEAQSAMLAGPGREAFEVRACKAGSCPFARPAASDEDLVVGISLKVELAPAGCLRIHGTPMPGKPGPEALARAFKACGEPVMAEGGNTITCEDGGVVIRWNSNPSVQGGPAVIIAPSPKQVRAVLVPGQGLKGFPDGQGKTVDILLGMPLRRFAEALGLEIAEGTPSGRADAAFMKPRIVELGRHVFSFKSGKLSSALMVVEDLGGGLALGERLVPAQATLADLRVLLPECQTVETFPGGSRLSCVGGAVLWGSGPGMKAVLHLGRPVSLVAGFMARESDGPGTRARVVGPEGKPLFLADPPVFTAFDLASVEMTRDAAGPRLVLRLLASGQARLAAATGAGVGQRLAILDGDRVLSAPVVKTRVDSGVVSLGEGLSEAELKRLSSDLSL